jgi:hypothetical protein
MRFLESHGSQQIVFRFFVFLLIFEMEGNIEENRNQYHQRGNWKGIPACLTMYKWSHEGTLENGACRYSATMGKSVDRQRGRRVSNERERARRREERTQRIRRSIWNLGPEPLDQIISLSSGLVGRHATADGHGVLATLLLLLLQVLVVGHLLLLLVGHVTRVQAGAHIPLGRVDIVMSHILGSLGGDIGGVNTVLAGGGVRGIQTGLMGS